MINSAINYIYDINDEGEELFDKNGKQLDATYVKLASDKQDEDFYDRNLHKLGDNFRKIEAPIQFI
jgi:hypothetical protein